MTTFRNDPITRPNTAATTTTNASMSRLTVASGPAPLAHWARFESWGAGLGRKYDGLRAPLPHRRRVARPRPGGDGRGTAGRTADHGGGDPGRAGPPPPRFRPRPAHAVRAGRGHA